MKSTNVKSGDLIEVNGTRGRVLPTSQRYALHWVELKGKQKDRWLDVDPMGHQKVKLIRQNPKGRNLPITYWQPPPKKKRNEPKEPIPNKFKVRSLILNGERKLTHDYRPILDDDDAIHLAMWLIYHNKIYSFASMQELLNKMKKHWQQNKEVT